MVKEGLYLGEERFVSWKEGLFIGEEMLVYW